MSLANCEAVLKSAGAGLDDIVAKLGVELPGILVSIRMTAVTG